VRHYRVGRCAQQIGGMEVVRICRWGMKPVRERRTSASKPDLPLNGSYLASFGHPNEEENPCYVT
jgi:hypothetical protein